MRSFHVVAALLLLPHALPAANLTAGAWTLEYDHGRIGELRWQERPIWSGVTLGGYSSDYRATRYVLMGAPAEVRRDGETTTVQLSLAKPGHLTGSLQVRLTAGSVELELAGTSHSAGPVEFGIVLPPAGWARADGSLTVQRGPREHELSALPFGSLPVGTGWSVEQPASSSRWALQATAGSWMLQDKRREQPPALRLISVLRSTAEAPLGATARLELTPYDAATAAARRPRLEQRSRWVDRVDLPNASFETGAAPWAVPGNGAVEAGGRTGGQAARLTVGDPTKETVYITRQVPVVGGSYYQARGWVKTSGLRPAAGRMSSVGAGLIVEWADRQGKWLAAGDYACELWGDQPWTLRETGLLRAPEEAGFAVIFLAVRAVGTAWFDDLELDQVHRALKLTAPLPALQLADNTPLLTWREDPQALDYQVTLSRDPGFAAPATQRFSSTEAQLAVPRPLAPGTWYWKVAAPGYDDSAVWTIQQTAAVTVDTTAPQILLQPTRLTRTDEPLRLAVQDDQSDLAAITATANGQTLEVRGLAAGRAARPTLVFNWPLGLSTLQVTARDVTGNESRVEVPVLCRPVPARPTSIDAAGRYLEDGQAIFPRGIYQVSPAAMPTVKAAGFDVVHVYTWESSQDDTAARVYLDAAQAAGLRVFLGFDRGGSSGNGMVQGNQAHLAARVAALCDHPALFCWYLFDEPEVVHQYIAPRTLNAYAELVRQLDPYHVVVMTTWGPRMALYRRSFDTHWTQSYSPPAGVVNTLGEHRRLLGEGTPLTLLVHCYDQAQKAAAGRGSSFDPAAFQPDPAWLRAAAFAGITQRINGLWWWWYADGTNDWLTVADVPAAWAALTAVGRDVDSLEPVLAADTPVETGTLEAAGAKVVWWRRTVGGQTTLIAVNLAEAPATVAVPAPGDGPTTGLCGTTAVPRRGGQVTLALPRYGVAVLRW
ncbi:MAG: hypothetical protein IT204_05395 [Fimbriimonadaceae bacterium]|nr:hypothetical protein [Fimbriimonadaceae bacterium]